MTWELHITRRDHWGDGDGREITSDEWLAYVAGDPELRPLPEVDRGCVEWIPSTIPDAWLHLEHGNVSTTRPDTALYCKMLGIAAALDAAVQDDDGRCLRSPADFAFDPHTG